MVTFKHGQDLPGKPRFPNWIGDHTPRNVQVYCDSKLVLKWDLENQLPMQGRLTRKLFRLIAQLEREGRL